MTKKMEHLLKGIGSVMDIYPDASKYVHIVPRKTANERMRQAWESTGKQIQDAAGEFSNEQKEKKRHAK